MSEDRHTFSEARPIPGLDLPTWEVDVFRDGVPEPVMTLRVDNNSLPPRKSKKKKVAWKLPDTIDQVPRFGVDEKRRLLDIFKNIKKERRKSKTSTKQMGDDSEADGYYEESNHEHPTSGRSSSNNSVDVPTTNSSAPPLDNNAAAAYQNNNSVSNDQQSTLGMERLSVQDSARLPPGLNSTPEPPPGMMARTNSMSLPPGMSGDIPINLPTNQSAATTRAPPGMERSQSLPVEASPPPPPGMGLPQSSQTQPHQQHALGSENVAPPPNGEAIPPLQVPFVTSPSRYFAFPPTTPDDVFAQEVANTYVTLLQGGQVDELLLYYSLTAQKSLSLKSAHSMCSTPNDMKTQLHSLDSSVFVVHGITMQRGMNWILLVWSGMCQVAGQTHGYTHTLILVPTADSTNTAASGALGIPPAPSMEDHQQPNKYQIQNDALVLLAIE